MDLGKKQNFQGKKKKPITETNKNSARAKDQINQTQLRRENDLGDTDE